MSVPYHVSVRGSEMWQNLAALCEAALMSPDADVRQHAATTLSPLSHFSQWGALQQAMSETTNESVIFVCCKALKFIIANEIGPHERSEVQDFILNYVAAHSAALPRHLLNTLLNVYAVALHLNWRMLVVTLEEEEYGSIVGKRIIEKLEDKLTKDQCMYTLVELLQHFAKEEIRNNLIIVSATFAALVLPCCFEYATAEMNSRIGLVGTAAMCVRLALACLEYGTSQTSTSSTGDVSPSSGSTTEETSIRLGVSQIDCALHCAEYCNHLILSTDLIQMDFAFFGECLRVVRLIAAIEFHAGDTIVDFDSSPRSDSCDMSDASSSSPHHIGIQDSFFISMFAIFDDWLQLYRVTRNAEVLSQAIRGFRNLYDRYRRRMNVMITARPEFVDTISKIFVAVVSRWDEEEEEARDVTAHFALLLFEWYVGVSGSGAEVLGMDSTRAPSLTARGLLCESFTTYFDAFVSHTVIENEDIFGNIDENSAMNIIVKFIILNITDFGPLLRSTFKKYAGQYEWCLSIRNGAQVPPDALINVAMACSDAFDPSALSNVNDVLQFLTSVVLSRLAVLLQIMALILERRSATTNFFEEALDDAGILGDAVSFVNAFLQEDLTEALLGMSLSPSKTAAAASAAPKLPQPKLHIDIIRAILFFGSSLRQTAFWTQPTVHFLCSTILRFTLQHHSMNSIVANDAAMLLCRVSEDPNTIEGLIFGEQFTSILSAHAASEIPLTALTEPSIAFLCSQPSLIKSRKRLRAALMTLHSRRQVLRQELQFYEASLLASSRCLQSVEPASESAALVLHIFMVDIRGTLKGIKTSSSFMMLLDWFVGVCPVVMNLLFKNPTNVNNIWAGAIRTVAKMCETANWLLTEELHTPTQTEFCGAAARMILALAEAKNANLVGVTAAMLCDIAHIVHATLDGHWCNVAVMGILGDHDFERVMATAFSMLVDLVKVEDVMALPKKRALTFAGISAGLSFKYPSQLFLTSVFTSENMQKLLHYLLCCLQHSPLGCIISCIHSIVHRPDVIELVAPETVVRIFRETVVIVSTITYPEEGRALETCLGVIVSCHAKHPVLCEGELEKLLDFASAYHRVRIRSMLMMLRSPPRNFVQSFCMVFGTSARTSQTLTAW